MARALRDNKEYNEQEIVIERPDGSRRIALVHANPLYDESGQLAGAINILVDITERKQAKEALRRSEERLRDIFNQTTAGIAQVDLTGRFVLVNQRFCDITGYSAEQLRQKTCTDITHPDDQACNDRMFLQALQEHKSYVIEKRYIRPDGAYVWVRNSVSEIRDSDGRLQHMLAVCLDISDQKQAEWLLREQTQLLEKIAAGHSREECLTALTDAVARLHPNARAGVLMADADRTAMADAYAAHLPPAFAAGIRGAPINELLIGTCGTAIYEGKPVTCTDICHATQWSEMWRKLCLAHGIHACHSTPVFAPGGQAVASFVLGFAEARTPGDWELRLAEFGARIASIVIERDRAEAALRTSEERFRAIVNQASTGIAQTDPTGRFTLVNDRYCDITGRSREELLQIRMQDITHPDDLQHNLEQYQRLLEGGADFAIEKRYVRKDGSCVWVNNSVCATRDTAGQLQSLVAIVLEATERKRAEEALRKREEEFRTLADNIAQFAWMADGAGWIFWYNQRWFDYTGTTLEQMQGWGWQAVHHPDHVDRVVEKISRHWKSGEVWEDTFPLRGKDGNYRWFLSRAVPIRDAAGTIVRWFGTNTDITEQRATEEALKDADRRKDEFLATLAHELRNPLAPLRNGLQVMNLARNDAAAVEQSRAMMERQLAQLVRLVDDLLDVSRISRGTIELRKERIELSDVVSTALESCAPLIKQYGHELTVTLPDEPVYIDADKVRLAQALCNLLNNAAKYSDKEGRIRLTAERQGGDVVLSVKDNGIGIPAAMLPKVFDLFLQVDRSLEKSQSGLGIGLTIVKRLVEMHGGRIEAKSDGPGQGSEFRIRLPIARSLLAPQSIEPEGAPTCPAIRRRVLVVDDNVDVAQSLAMMLQIMGNEVCTAHDGLRGVEAAAAFRPDLILLDIGMPKLNGYEACRRIRQEPWGQGIILAALTGWGQDEDKRCSEEAGFDVHLVKPVKPSVLEKLLAQLQPAAAV